MGMEQVAEMLRAEALRVRVALMEFALKEYLKLLAPEEVELTLGTAQTVLTMPMVRVALLERALIILTAPFVLILLVERVIRAQLVILILALEI